MAKKKDPEKEVREAGVGGARGDWRRLTEEGEISGLWKDPAFFLLRSRQLSAMIAQAASGKVPWFIRVKSAAIEMPPKPETFELLAKVYRDTYLGELQRLISGYTPKSPIEQLGIETAIQNLGIGREDQNMGNGRWRPEKSTLADILPAEAIDDLVPIMNHVQRGDLDLAMARREIFGVLEPHSKAFHELQIDVPNFAFKLAYFAKGPTGGPLGEVTLKEIESPNT